MKRTLRTSKPIPDMKNVPEHIDPGMIGSIQDAVDKYGGKSEKELIGELAAAKQSGLIDPDSLTAVAGRIAPMLTPEQQQRLQAVLKQLQ